MAEPAAQGRLLAWKVALLCIASGALDAVTFLAVADAFASVMTGNIVLLGVAAGGMDGLLAAACGVAVAGYVVGGMAGARLAHVGRVAGEPVWPPRVTRTLAAELVLLVALALVWTLDPSPGDLRALMLLALAGAAMGAQGAAVRQVGVAVSTTYMTGALTSIAEIVATRGRWSGSHRNGLVGLLALLGGALLGGLAVHSAPALCLWLPCLAVTTVVALGYGDRRARIRSEAGGT